MSNSFATRNTVVDEAMGNLFNGLFGPTSKPNKLCPHPHDACPIQYAEPNKIIMAIDFYEKRLAALKKVSEMGFDTLQDYVDYKEAEKLIANHKKKMEGKVEETQQ